MQIEEGKKYKDKDGKLHGPMRQIESHEPAYGADLWCELGYEYGCEPRRWFSDGKEWPRSLFTSHDLIDPVSECVTGKKLQIEEGKNYVDRKGNEHGPMIKIDQGACCVWQEPGNPHYNWHDDGRLSPISGNGFDRIGDLTHEIVTTPIFNKEADGELMLANLKETNRRLNRRCQKAEHELAQLEKHCRASVVSLRFETKRVAKYASVLRDIYRDQVNEKKLLSPLARLRRWLRRNPHN